MHIYSFSEKLLISGEQMDASTYSSCHGYSPAETVFGMSMDITLVTNKVYLLSAESWLSLLRFCKD